MRPPATSTIGAKRLGEGIELGLAAGLRQHLQNVARAEIPERDHPPERHARFALDAEADEIGEIKFVLLRRRQALARQIKL